MFQIELISLLNDYKKATEDYSKNKIKSSISKLIQENGGEYQNFIDNQTLDSWATQFLDECEKNINLENTDEKEKNLDQTEIDDDLKKIKLQKRDYITIEYLMLHQVNDTIEHAKKLVKLLNPLKVKVNLIPYNPTKTLNKQASTEEQINIFAKYLVSKSIMVTVRRSKGKSIQGGCGQFALKKTISSSEEK